MKKVFYLALAVAATAAGLSACKPDTAKTATDTAANSPASPAAVRAQLDALRDSADVEWRRMIGNDDQKLADLRALLGDLGKQPSVNAAQVEPLRVAAARLQRQRYTRESMTSSALIDRYDSAQDSVLHQVLPLAAPNSNAPTEQIRDLVEHIQLIDANVVTDRSHYDRAAKAYNAYLQVHSAELSQMGGKYAGLQPMPLFEVPAK